MKRIGNVFDKIVNIENLKIADKKAKRGKLNQKEIREYFKDREFNLQKLYNTLINGEFETSKYSIFRVYEPKERVISKLPFFPDRVTQWGVYLQLEKIFTPTFTADTYSAIKGRGIHKMSDNLEKSLKDVENTKYCLKLDIKQFYPSVNNEILKKKIRRKIKCERTLDLLDNIINSAKGLPLGNLLSQLFANIYLNELDHYIKQELKVKYYFRYCDDICILSGNKQELHRFLHIVRQKLIDLKLELKDNYQIFPIEKRGIDVVGYRHFHTHKLLRKSIKKRYIKNKNKKTHYSWLKHCNSKNLREKYENN
jgi:RNA-directed DNA polymerase